MKNMPVIVLGGGGHAKVLIDTLLQQSVDILGFTDLTMPSEEKILGVRYLGPDSIIYGYSTDSIMLVNGLGSIGAVSRRKHLFCEFKKRGYSFMNVVHPSAVVSPSAVLSEGVQIMAGGVIQSGSTIGENSIVNTKGSVDHDCIIGAHVHLAPGVTLCGGVKIGDEVHIGAGATVIQNIDIGRKSVIGAGALVLKNVPEKVTVYGIPAREV
ncbi:acetyltransferase [Brevibacillus massiliensis]|uniref:acetyltransferase n=1 Tax=Brevibacillus massiliensis TaxID=1118054 RepID=UPI000365DDB8|nr:acetyltransferase [Brevibacillus massiliensis]